MKNKKGLISNIIIIVASIISIVFNVIDGLGVESLFKEKYST